MRLRAPETRQLVQQHAYQLSEPAVGAIEVLEAFQLVVELEHLPVQLLVDAETGFHDDFPLERALGDVVLLGEPGYRHELVQAVDLGVRHPKRYGSVPKPTVAVKVPLRQFPRPPFAIRLGPTPSRLLVGEEVRVAVGDVDALEAQAVRDC